MTVLPGKGIPIGFILLRRSQTAPNVACAVKFITWMLSDELRRSRSARRAIRRRPFRR
jgi:hypothetical protein